MQLELKNVVSLDCRDGEAFITVDTLLYPSGSSGEGPVVSTEVISLKEVASQLFDYFTNSRGQFDTQQDYDDFSSIAYALQDVGDDMYAAADAASLKGYTFND